MLTITSRKGGGDIQAYYAQMQTEKVGQLEDYYAREAESFWLGEGAQRLGLYGQHVETGDFNKAAAGILPDESQRVKNAEADGRRAGYDFTFSAPKGVSVAWALTDDETKQKIEGAMRQAVAAALEFTEDEAAKVRSGKDGIYKQRASLLASCYLHQTSRNLDPQLHIHAFIHNVALGVDGKARTLEMREAYEYQKAIGAAFRVELADKMRGLGYTVERDGESFRLAEISQALEKAFSSRRTEILAHLKARGIKETGASKEMATLATRRAKQPTVLVQLNAQWRERSEGVSVSQEREAAQRKRGRNRAGADDQGRSVYSGKSDGGDTD